MEIPYWLKPAQTLKAIEGGSDAGYRQAALMTQAREAALARQPRGGGMPHFSGGGKSQEEIALEKKAKEDADLKEQQQLQIENARKESELGLKQDAQKREADQAAKQYAAQQKLSQLIASGISPEKAIFMTPELLSATAISSGVRANIPKATPMDTIVESQNFPATKATEGMPAIPPRKEGGFFGFGGKDIPGIPAVPPMPAQPGRTVRKSYKVPHGTNVDNANTPSQSDVDYLMKNPSKAAQFNSKFGAGSAESILGGQSDSAEEDQSTPSE